MFTTIISDCYEENEAGRQMARFNSSGLGPTNLVGVKSNFSDHATAEGGANLIDILDATEGKQGIVVLNVAPRGNKKEGGNGTHFSYFFYKDTLVISTLKGYCLSFVKKFKIAQSVGVVELTEVLDFTLKNKLINKELKNYIVKSQFRSFDFVPRLARWIIDGIRIPSKEWSLKHVPEIPGMIWCIDAFGNTKTTLLSNDLNLVAPKMVETNFGFLKYYDRLKDVPFGETAIYTGSSGIENNRFLELANQGVPGSAAKKLKLKVGDIIKIK
jgi:hypothetical protein